MMAQHDGTSTSRITCVQVDGLVVLKIIKHCHEEVLTSQDAAHGILLGLAQEEKLEVTNCFPYPRIPDEDISQDVTPYEIDMQRNLRQVNVDYMSVGIYQSGYGGTFLNRASLDSLFNYQNSISESVLLIYDPTRNWRGQIAIRAYRLTPEVMKLLCEAKKEEDSTTMQRHPDAVWEPEVLQNMRLNFSQLFTEVQVVIRNSHLINALLFDLDERLPRADRFSSLDLGVGASMERQLKLLMVSLDDTFQDIQRHINYQKQISRYQSGQGDQSGRNRDQDRPVGPPRLESTLLSSQVNQYCQELAELAGQTMGKVMMTQSVQQNPKLGH